MLHCHVCVVSCAVQGYAALLVYHAPAVCIKPENRHESGAACYTRAQGHIAALQLCSHV